jgi:hypothetical protein
MSLIWKKLRQAEKQRSGGLQANEARPPGDQLAERRASKRALVHLPVMVPGHTAGEEPFQEDTEAICVNVRGCLITLTTSVTGGQYLILTNKATERDEECRVVYQGSIYSQRAVVGVGFARPIPDFWL